VGVRGEKSLGKCKWLDFRTRFTAQSTPDTIA
jgi:hypothetical protein